jgi:hypothetical protein
VLGVGVSPRSKCDKKRAAERRHGLRHSLFRPASTLFSLVHLEL